MNLAVGQIIGGRYKISRQLGQGGFGTTFVSQDQHLPGDRYCVVKQLKPQGDDSFTLQTARRLFDTEAKILHKLGTHDQIPQLFAYFEENQEFYLVQELIEGHDLSKELIPGKPLTQLWTISLLREILEILEYVHQQHVIHRDINPRNLIRRKQDGKLVLIDFGAVKQVSTQILNGKQTSFTVAIGTPGYRPSEQANGNPRLSSDIYAVGMVGISALTGLLPHELPADGDTVEIIWRDRATVTDEFAKVLDKMIRYDFRERYPSASSALQALNDIGKTSSATVALPSVSSPNRSGTPAKFYKPILYKSLMGIGAIAILSAGTLSILHWRNSSNATDLYHRGETLLELKRYEEALNAYHQAVEIRPDYVDAWQGQGDTLLALNQYQDALNAYDKAIQIKPDYLEAWKGRGKALDQLQRYEEAINAFDAVIKIQAKDFEAWENIGTIEIKMQQYSAAIASFDKALDIQPDYAPVWYQRGWALQNLRQYEEAIKSYDKAVEYKPDSAQAWYQRGNSLINLQKSREAVESYDKAVQFQPNFYRAWYSKGSILMNLGQYQEALVSFEQAVKFQPNSYEGWYGRAWALHQLQRYQDAIEIYDKALRLRPNSNQALYNKGNALYNLKRYQDAIASYKKAVAIKPDYYQAWYSLGNALVNWQREQDAIAFNPQFYEEAIAAYDQALRYKPDYHDALQAKERVKQELSTKRIVPDQSQSEESTNQTSPEPSP
ncbi:MAG TPA: protein kinase [Cyanobacteria bacterium UBA12227]|nr:protein kinase [Cyanobacteria bacterium UBA12227]HAX86741.1 protein kinase [Cyanobacteria bacterium UBA11370]HBY80985.1 protein kinase [Cyanobacteria bacterium UBA11148]